jgi:hypothetical protein
VATYDGIGSQKLYVDGELKAFASSVVYNNPSGSGAPIIIGDAAGSCGGGTFSASIDEVKIYGASLDANQVMALYNKSRGSGNALLFQGNSLNRVELPGPLPAPPAFSLEAWVKRNAVQQWQWLFSGAEVNSWQWGLNGNTMLFGKVNAGGAVVSNPISIDDGKWHHLAVVYDGNTGATSFFVDGVSKGTGSISSTGAVPGTYSIGNKSGTTNSFDGFIDEFRVWGVALDITTIRNWMCRKITPDHPNFWDLGFDFNFDEPTLTRAYDVKNGQNAQLFDGPQYVTSGAAIGDVSSYDFTTTPGTKSAVINLNSPTNTWWFRASEETAGTVEGITVYEVKDLPVNRNGILGLGGTDHYFGVHVSGTGTYRAIYSYAGNPLVSYITEPTLQLFKRNNNSDNVWINSGATLNTGVKRLIATGQNTEYILGSSGFALPVTLLSFQVQKITATTAKLTWQTATELNNKGFEVQRSFDGNYFVTIEFVNGAGNSNDIRYYNTTDVPGRTGRVFYRLKQVDIDNNFKLSAIASVVFSNPGLVKVYPNPAQREVTLEGINEVNTVQLLDASGRKLKEQLNKGQFSMQVDLTGLKNGIYLLRLIKGKDTETVKLVIGN